LRLDQVEDLLAIEQAPRSLDAPAGEGEVGVFGDLLADPLADDAYERVLDGIEEQELHVLLRGLSDRERAVLRARYGLDGEPETMREVAGRLGVSAERVRQVERRALGKLESAWRG
ncbi:MAG: polymerase, sigma 32 subunit, RpoH, partial [Solirubrobacterales bacterium]|nr:polymerase, sigma 32 subunit, RpoH [Solirubrobacterales bacterium]